MTELASSTIANRLDSIAIKLANFRCESEVDSNKVVFDQPEILSASYPKAAKIFPRPPATSVSNRFDITEQPSVVRSGTTFSDSQRSVSIFFSFRSSSSRFHRKAAHSTLAAGSSLLTEVIALSNNTNLCLSIDNSCPANELRCRRLQARPERSLYPVTSQLQLS